MHVVLAQKVHFSIFQLMENHKLNILTVSFFRKGELEMNCSSIIKATIAHYHHEKGLLVGC